MNAKRISYSVVAALALTLACGLPAHAQRGRRPARPQVARPQPAQPRPVRRPTPGQRIERAQIPRSWMDRLQSMPPRQQQRFLENNRRFRSLPPRQQAQIRARLKQWNRLTPAQRKTLIRRAQILERMSPRERREIRQVILPEWRQLPPGRRNVLVNKLRQLQGLKDSQREKRLDNPKFVQDLSPKERKLLRQLSRLKVGSGGESL